MRNRIRPLLQCKAGRVDECVSKGHTAFAKITAKGPISEIMATKAGSICIFNIPGAVFSGAQGILMVCSEAGA